MNPLSAEAMEGLRDVARWLKGDIETHCVIVTGARVFSIGADLKDPDMRMNARHPDATTKALTGPDMCAAWEALEQVTICAMERYAIGGALALAACRAIGASLPKIVMFACLVTLALICLGRPIHASLRLSAHRGPNRW